MICGEKIMKEVKSTFPRQYLAGFSSSRDAESLTKSRIVTRVKQRPLFQKKKTFKPSLSTALWSADHSKSRRLFKMRRNTCSRHSSHSPNLKKVIPVIHEGRRRTSEQQNAVQRKAGAFRAERDVERQGWGRTRVRAGERRASMTQTSSRATCEQARKERATATRSYLPQVCLLRRVQIMRGRRHNYSNLTHDRHQASSISRLADERANT